MMRCCLPGKCSLPIVCPHRRASSSRDEDSDLCPSPQQCARRAALRRRWAAWRRLILGLRERLRPAEPGRAAGSVGAPTGTPPAPGLCGWQPRLLVLLLREVLDVAAPEGSAGPAPPVQWVVM